MSYFTVASTSSISLSNYQSARRTGQSIPTDYLLAHSSLLMLGREAFISSKKIKSIFEVFNDKTNGEEI